MHLILGAAAAAGRVHLGAAEMREMDMQNANKSVKMAQKRAMVDAILRCAGLSEWFTQDLEEPPHLSPLPTREVAAGVDGRCLPTQITSIRLWLHRSRKSEREILAFYGIGALDELSRAVADQLLTRLQELSQSPL